MKTNIMKPRTDETVFLEHAAKFKLIRDFDPPTYAMVV